MTEQPADHEARPDHADHEPANDEPAHDESGLDLARSIARKFAARHGTGTRKPARSGRPAVPSRRSRAPAGPGDEREPRLLDEAVGRFVTERGWQDELRVHGVFSRWSALVGREVAEHVAPESFADGRLVVRADSTAWATQMKLLAAQVVRRLNEVLGDQTVEVIDVVGPRAPSWTRGRYRVRGRGPRDTYG